MKQVLKTEKNPIKMWLAEDEMGVIHSIRSKKDLDEATGAYKDIAMVMANQTDLVDVEVILRPLAVVKG